MTANVMTQEEFETATRGDAAELLFSWTVTQPRKWSVADETTGYSQYSWSEEFLGADRLHYIYRMDFLRQPDESLAVVLFRFGRRYGDGSRVLATIRDANGSIHRGVLLDTPETVTLSALPPEAIR
jgi:hypothetical protein